MSIRAIEVSKKLRAEGKRLGREGLSQRVLILVEEFAKKPNYKDAMILAGRLKAITQAAKFDGYWDEMVSRGFEPEVYDLCSFEKIPTDDFWSDKQ